MANGHGGQTLTADQLEVGKKWLQLVAQARADKTLKQRLVDTPVVVLQEHGINVRQGLDIRIVEDTDKVVYLNLPAKAELTDRDLDGVVGGSDLTEAANGAILSYNLLMDIMGFRAEVRLLPE